MLKAELVDVIEPDRDLQAEALRVSLGVACHLDHPVYDCLFLALARREAAVLFTAGGCSPDRPRGNA